MTITIGYVVGSLSGRSINRKLTDALVSMAPNGLEFAEIPIGDLPMYNYDADDDYPPAAVTLKAAIRNSDALLFATPEYNRSIPGALKNALDWGSRPYGDNAWGGRPGGIIGASVGETGTSMAQQHLRNILAYLDVPAMTQPEAFIQYTSERFAEDGTVRDDSTREFLGSWMTAYAEWVGHFVDV